MLIEVAKILKEFLGHVLGVWVFLLEKEKLHCKRKLILTNLRICLGNFPNASCGKLTRFLFRNPKNSFLFEFRIFGTPKTTTIKKVLG